MTLIASFKINNIPCIIGDLLISSIGIPAPSVHLPTTGNVANWFPKGKFINPSGMVRKLCLIENIAFGWSGNVGVSKAIINEVRRKISSDGPIPMDSLQEIFSTLPNSLKDPIDAGAVSFTGYLLNPQNGEPQHFSINSPFIQSSHLEDLHVSGSGVDIFLNNLSLINENGNNPKQDIHQSKNNSLE